jgi:hypothetical protein
MTAQTETEAWGIGKVIERFIHVTEDGDVEHLNMASPGEALMEVVKQVYEPVSAGSITFEKTSKIIAINPSALRLVLSIYRARYRKTCKCNPVDQRRHTQQERRPHSHRLLSTAHSNKRRKYTQDRHVLSSAAKMEIMCLIATNHAGDVSANTNAITGEEVTEDRVAGRAGAASGQRPGRGVWCMCVCGWMSAPKAPLKAPQSAAKTQNPDPMS